MKHFISDPHFGHKKIIDLCHRPFASVEEMETELIKRWNAVVAVDDEVYMLGDMFFCGTIKAKEIFAQLRGKKRWIMGNHDWGKFKKHRATEYGVEWMVDAFCVRIGAVDVKLSHFPYKGAGDHTERERFNDMRLLDDGGWLLHGHVHCEWKIKGKQINVGVDQWNFTPVSEHQILEMIK